MAQDLGKLSMKNFLLSVLFFVLSGFFYPSYADCSKKPDYIPDNYTVVSCGRYYHVSLESYVVKDVNGKFGAYTYWAEPSSEGSKYNRMAAAVVYDEIIPQKDGFIVRINNKYGYIHVDKGAIFDVKYDKIYLSENQKRIYAQSGSVTTEKDNPDNISDKIDKITFNIFIRPLFFWLDSALPSR